MLVTKYTKMEEQMCGLRTLKNFVQSEKVSIPPELVHQMAKRSYKGFLGDFKTSSVSVARMQKLQELKKMNEE